LGPRRRRRLDAHRDGRDRGGQLAFGPAPAGAYGDAPADCGAVQMLGDVWEWTASDFNGYPGFEAFPYREYSEVFFGPEHRVLRGGAWATRRDVIRTSFRNWDLPERRQIFSGLRCVKDL
jgi:iron(II)-dependent oxidoreductase